MLPPLHHSLRELNAILSDKTLIEQLGSAELIEQISKTDLGYRLFTTRYILDVVVRYLPSDYPGPGQFTLDYRPLQRR